MTTCFFLFKGNSHVLQQFPFGFLPFALLEQFPQGTGFPSFSDDAVVVFAAEHNFALLLAAVRRDSGRAAKTVWMCESNLKFLQASN